MRTLAFVPARSGSKSVPNKNIRPVAGVPLLHYTVRCAVRSGLFPETLVSTDERSYLAGLAELGAGTDYLRPPALAQDDSPTLPVVLHALDWLLGRGTPAFEAVMILQPTAPFRAADHLRRALELLEANPEADSVVGICRLADHHPARIKKLDGPWLRDFCVPEPDGSRRQDLKPPAYIRNGTIYLSRMSTLRGKNSILGNRVLGLEMPEANSINVDTELDFLLAEAALRHPPYSADMAFFRDFAASRGASR